MTSQRTHRNIACMVATATISTTVTAPTPISDSLTQSLTLLPAHIAELEAVWRSDKRMPSLKSRRSWAEARGVVAATVHTWFQRKRYSEGTRAGVRLPDGTYELDTGEYPPSVARIKEESASKFQLTVKPERAASPSLRVSRRPKVPLASAVPALVRHTRAHDADPNPLCHVCAQTFLATALGGPDTSSISPTLDAPQDDIRIKRERAASPALSLPNKRQEVVTVKREDVTSPSLDSRQPPRPRKRRQLKRTPIKSLQTDAHDSLSPSPPPSALPSSDFEYGLRSSTPATSEDRRLSPDCVSGTALPRAISPRPLASEFTFWPGFADSIGSDVQSEGQKTDTTSPVPCPSSAYTRVFHDLQASFTNVVSRPQVTDPPASFTATPAEDREPTAPRLSARSAVLPPRYRHKQDRIYLPSPAVTTSSAVNAAIFGRDTIRGAGSGLDSTSLCATSRLSATAPPALLLGDVHHFGTPLDLAPEELPPPSRPPASTPSRPGSPQGLPKPARPSSESPHRGDLEEESVVTHKVKTEVIDDAGLPPRILLGVVVSHATQDLETPVKQEASAVISPSQRKTTTTKNSRKPRLRPNPISSRTKRALGRPGRSLRVSSATSASPFIRGGLLSVLSEHQAYTKLHHPFGSMTLKRGWTRPQNLGKENELELVRLSRSLRVALQLREKARASDPPRAVAYDENGLKVFEEVMWDVGQMRGGGKNVKKMGSSGAVETPGDDACWELSAIPWLAATASPSSSSPSPFGDHLTSTPSSPLISSSTHNANADTDNKLNVIQNCNVTVSSTAAIKPADPQAHSDASSVFDVPRCLASPSPVDEHDYLLLDVCAVDLPDTLDLLDLV
ncbi:hypothetical protein EIP91_006743 [Steccherinum ochraceum]|uniref:Homeobox domain-containing protein n=1 Tax=Steccherinum ochraceum TaxID=92696 RepID=A0A4R0RB34_9APHY|nr:hypothetical protein EIP91_006743 [Steccherinum ochraceum]